MCPSGADHQELYGHLGWGQAPLVVLCMRSWHKTWLPVLAPENIIRGWAHAASAALSVLANMFPHIARATLRLHILGRALAVLVGGDPGVTG